MWAAEPCRIVSTIRRLRRHPPSLEVDTACTEVHLVFMLRLADFQVCMYGVKSPLSLKLAYNRVSSASICLPKLIVVEGPCDPWALVARGAFWGLPKSVLASLASHRGLDMGAQDLLTILWALVESVFPKKGSQAILEIVQRRLDEVDGPCCMVDIIELDLPGDLLISEDRAVVNKAKDDAIQKKAERQELKEKLAHKAAVVQRSRQSNAAPRKPGATTKAAQIAKWNGIKECPPSLRAKRQL